MKKLILTLVFVFATILMINAKNEIQDDKSASDCVKSSRSSVEALADAYGWDIHNGGSESGFAVDVFMVLYQDCLNQ